MMGLPQVATLRKSYGRNIGILRILHFNYLFKFNMSKGYYISMIIIFLFTMLSTALHQTSAYSFNKALKYLD